MIVFPIESTTLYRIGERSNLMLLLFVFAIALRLHQPMNYLQQLLVCHVCGDRRMFNSS